jgi:anti-sigma regulatory factor (Ser/Thr protein kinase)
VLEASGDVATNLPAAAASARAARRFVTDTLARWECGDLTETVELLTCELVTNVVLHARSAVEVRIRRVADALRVEVADPSPDLPQTSGAVYADDAATGRGLVLVDALAAAWGVEPTADGKVVWFEVLR